jgi:ATP-dependent Lon protease
MTDLPWSKSSKDNLDLHKAEKILAKIGLEKVKERIIEALQPQTERETKGTNPLSGGISGYRQSQSRSIDCPRVRPGFMRLSLGGVHDEAGFADIAAPT